MAKKQARKIGEFELTEADVEHRTAQERFVRTDAAPWHKLILGSILFPAWYEYNATFFDSVLIVPYIELSEPPYSRALG